MGRRKRDDGFDKIEAIVTFAGGSVLLMALAAGGAKGFPALFRSAVGLLTIVFGLVGLAVVFWLLRYLLKTPVASAPQPSGVSALTGDSASIAQALGEIDWFQFEKFCAALLRADGFVVERKGGAQPDGGVDLIATKNGQSMLVQCKHWRTWTVQERVIREMLGSMAHFGVSRGAIYTLKGWSQPAAAFAAQHNITLRNGPTLAQLAQEKLSRERLDDLLLARAHHCPKCESQMVLRTGNFTPFWGCSQFPRCRGTLKHTGAR